MKRAAHLKGFVGYFCSETLGGPVVDEEYGAACGVVGGDLHLIDELQDVTCKRCLLLICDSPEEVKA